MTGGDAQADFLESPRPFIGQSFAKNRSYPPPSYREFLFKTSKTDYAMALPIKGMAF